MNANEIVIGNKFIDRCGNELEVATIKNGWAWCWGEDIAPRSHRLEYLSDLQRIKPKHKIKVYRLGPNVYTAQGPHDIPLHTEWLLVAEVEVDAP